MFFVLQWSYLALKSNKEEQQPKKGMENKNKKDIEQELKHKQS